MQGSQGGGRFPMPPLQGEVAALRAVVAGYLLYLGGSLIWDLLKGSSTLPPALAWAAGLGSGTAGATSSAAGASGSGSIGAGAANSGAPGRARHSRSRRDARRERAAVAADCGRWAQTSVVTRRSRKKDRGMMPASRRLDVHKKLKSCESFR